MNYNQIVWLSSYPKSGNTWLRCFLDAYVLGTVDINKLLVSVNDDGSQRALPGDGSDPAKYPVDVQILTRPMALLRLVRQYVLYTNEQQIDVPLFVKTHNANMVTNGIELLSLPLTKAVIHIVRDPRDVIISFAKHMGCDIDEALIHFFDKYRVLHDKRKPKLVDFLGSWPYHVQSFANADTHNVAVFRYEDMKEFPVQTFSKMLLHAGIKPDEERVKKALDLVALDKLQKQEKEKGFGESSPYAKDQFFGKGETGGWRGKLTPNQLRKIEKGCASMMKRFRYEPSMRIVA